MLLTNTRAPVKIILDTNMGNGIDDAFTLVLQNHNEGGPLTTFIFEAPQTNHQ